ncbi:MAG: hypothetical protein V1708_00580 [Candidatus Micrarchaeota archaeon]
MDYQDQMPPVQMTSVTADVKKPFLKMTTRWNYISPWVDVWKQSIRFRTFAIVSLIAGAYLLFTIPLLAIIAFASAAYYWQLYKFRMFRLQSQRSVMIGH